MVLDDVCCAVGVRDDFLDQHPTIVEESMRRGGRDLLHAPVDVVVARPLVKPNSTVNICHFLAHMIVPEFSIDQMNLGKHICIRSRLPPP